MTTRRLLVLGIALFAAGLWCFSPAPAQIGIVKSLVASCGQSGNDGFTKLLLHNDGPNASTIFRDSSPSVHSVSAVGNAQVSTSQWVFGAASATFDGTGDSLSIADSPDWSLGSGSFTVDLRARFSAIGTTAKTLLWQGQDANNFMHFFADTNSSLGVTFKSAGTTLGAYNTNATYTTNTWYHVAFVRNGTSFLIFVNGTSEALTTFTAIGSNSLGDYTSALSIGEALVGTTPFNGFIDELRFSKGIARWTANFVPPPQPYCP